MGNAPSSNDNDGDNGDQGATANEGRRPHIGLASRGLSHRIVGGGSNNNAHRTGLSVPHLNLPSSLPSPFRSGGSLGLSRSELDARCQPSGLYPTCEWESKQIRRLIGNGQLAARLKGSDARLTKTDRECPICFMYYSESNVSKCCNATLCTECYLQIKPQKDRYTTCPFCNNPKMAVSVQRGMDEGDVARREEEEQKVIEATIKSRVSELNGEAPGGGSGVAEDGSRRDSGETASQNSFGSSLENYNRARTLSASSNASGHSTSSDTPGTPINPTGSGDADSDSSALMSLAMSPADRRALESEMRAQLSHETHRRMESEAEEARMRHAQEWYGSQAGSRSRMREARLAELTGLLERMSARAGESSAGAGEDDNDNSLMAGEGARGLGNRGSGGASLSRLLRAMESSSNTRGGGSSSLEDLMRLEAAFFLGSMDDDTAANRARQRGLLGRSSRNSDEDNDDDDDNTQSAVALGGLGGLERYGPNSSAPFGLAGARAAPTNRRVVRRLAGNRGVSSTHLDTAELLMRGVSEEEQLAMAIAMSMQDAQQQGTQSEGGGGSGEQAGEAEEGGITEESGEEDEDDDDSSSSESSSSSSESSEDGADDQSNSTNDIEEVNINNNNANRLSLDDDEEEVTFTDLAEV
eukprot:CAMPEP_0183787846 /NCGR_PEP_ID=MMETSP0739-20130205/67753_1 /TAXON_ID=385413 /ORGANISM="Thalassiosira miniscula, Strain CCMP1093" /LENGTH=640 /DNA_ID=CAMNT_0026031939 /DNA_START=37 /DNA_END=1959 /DNA_ORIENTATION=-